MNQIIQCDIAIIGGGAGGLSLAAGAAQLGANIVLIESGKMGGDCLNYGCVPSKSLLAVAKSIYYVKEASYFGVHAKTLTVNFTEVMHHVQSVIATIAKHDSVERFESFGVRVIQAPGQFINSDTLQACNYTVKAKRFVVATGSLANVPSIPGLTDVTYETNETIFNITTLPAHLIIIGAGPIGCELAQAFSMLGSKVTLLDSFKLLPHDDADCVSILRDQFEVMGIAVYEMINVKEVQKNVGDGITVKIERQGKTVDIKGSHLLVAAGRRANVDGLALEKAGVVFSSKGIQVDRRLRSTNKKIYAIGDVVGDYQFTHIANYHAGIVLRNILFKLPAKLDYRAMPWVTYTEPEIAHVGMQTDAATKSAGTQVTEWLFEENDRAQTAHQTQGKIKVITDSKARVLGATIVGAAAGELILPWVMAVRERKSLRSFTDVIIPYPTLSEISKRVAGEFYKPKLFSGKLRWLVRQLLKLG